MNRQLAFTLIELVVVILIIAVLAGLSFPVYQSIQNSAKKTRAKNDATQIVTAVTAYYTEYGKYPIATTDDPINPTSDLFYTLRAVPEGANAADARNSRKVVFLSPPDATSPTQPKSGIASQSATVNGIAISAGEFVDPWGTPYKIAIDGDYDNQIINNPYGANTGAGAQPLRQGVICWSWGKDQKIGKDGSTTFTGSDDVISWQ